MSKNFHIGKLLQRTVCLCVAFLLALSFSVPSSAAVSPLPGPSTPFLYDDFNSGGYHTGAWQPWYSSSGSGAWSKTTADGRTVGKFTQTPADSSSFTEFSSQNAKTGQKEYLSNFYGYKYLTVTMKNPGYPDCRIKFEFIDNNGVKAALSGGYISVPEDWTVFNFDFSSFTNLNLKNVTLRISLTQTSGAYGEMLIDDIKATSDYSGTAPVLTDTGVSADSGTDLTTFQFKATYTDPDNQAPLNMQLVLDDSTAIEMNEADRGDFVYTDGKQYTYSTKLAVGSHSYYFRTTDGTSDTVATASQSITVNNSTQVVDVNDNTTGTGGNQFQYSGNWTYGAAGSGSYQSDQHTASDTDAYAAFTFVGTAVKLYGAKDPAYGIAAFSIDGGAELNVDAYAAARAEHALLYTSPTLPKGTHTLKIRVTGNKNTASSGTAVAVDQVNATTYIGGLVESVDVSQAGYSASDYKVASVTADEALADTSYQILKGSSVVASGTMKDEGETWGKHVYSIDFSSLTQTGTDFTIRTNGTSSYAFPIQANMWSSYKDEMTAFYRLLREADTTVSYPAGYSDIAPSQKALHPDCFLDDAVSADGTHYDLTGGWQDAGDYGKYGGNQWVGGEIALAYLRHSGSSDVNYDNDKNGIPDLIDEAQFGSDYLVKFADQFNGAVYDILRAGGFVHPDKVTDNVVGTSDDRQIAQLCVGGSAKAAGTLAATARAIHDALDHQKIASDQVAEMTAAAAKYEAAAVTCYNFAINNQTGNQGSYTAPLDSGLLFAETELYLLTGTESYKTSATARTMALTDASRSTNYWSMTPMALAELYPVADAAAQDHIHTLLRGEMDYFLSVADDTPYGTWDSFGSFGVNEPLGGYIADALRYNELFPDAEVMQTALKGLYWIMGDNPWNISWVSGIGSDYVDYLHTRLDEDSYNTANRGIVIPGAMVSGPNMVDTLDASSTSPWYADRGLFADDLNQWRYNEYSISINAGLLYSVIALTDTHGTGIGGTSAAQMVVSSPSVSDEVTGDVTLFAKPTAAMSSVETNAAGSYAAMTNDNGVYTATVSNTDGYYTPKTFTVRGTDADGRVSSTMVQYKVAQPLPDPSHPLVYDDFTGGGTFGSQSKGWQNWYSSGATCTGKFTQKADDGTQLVVDGKTAGSFYHNPASTSIVTRFQPWHDTIDISGYRYMTVVVENPSSPNTQVSFTGSGWSGSGYLTVPSGWTTYTFDLNNVSDANKKAFEPLVNLKQTVVGSGTVYISKISFTNQASGTAPTITGTSLNQTSGNAGTLFTFNATYTDADNQKPYKMQLVLDGVIKDMLELDVSDTTCTDGKQYTYSTKLPEGTHSYYFRATDTTSDAVKTAVQTGPSVSGAMEAEALPLNAVSPSHTVTYNAKASGGAFDLLNAHALGDYIEYKVNIAQSGTYDVKLRVMKYNNNGMYQLAVDGVDQGSAFDTYYTGPGYSSDYDLGTVTFDTAGEKLFRFTCTGKKPNASGYKLPTDYILLTPA